VVRRQSKHDVDAWQEEPAEQFLPDEVAQEIQTASTEVRERLTKLEQQMLAQYSAMAAYATIAQTATDGARVELRHDIDRSQATMIGLIERVRRECNDAIAGVEARLGGGPGGESARLVALESKVVSLEAMLEASLEAQRKASETIAVLVRDRMERDGWLVSDGTADELSLR
jgi:hypothetical protein